MIGAGRDQEGILLWLGRQITSRLSCWRCMILPVTVAVDCDRQRCRASASLPLARAPSFLLWQQIQIASVAQGGQIADRLRGV